MDAYVVVVDTWPETEYSYKSVEEFLPYIILKEFLNDTTDYDNLVAFIGATSAARCADRGLLERYYERMSDAVHNVLKRKGLDVIICELLQHYRPHDCEITKNGELYLEFELI